MAFKPIDPKRDEFRRYLERNGVIESLTKVFVRIVKERPENPLEYLRTNLGDTLQEEDHVNYLRNEIKDARSEVQRLRSIIQSVSPQTLEEYDREMQQQQQQEQLLQPHHQLQEQELALANDNDSENIDDKANIAIVASTVMTSSIDVNDVVPKTEIKEEKVKDNEVNAIVAQVNDVEGQKENIAEKAALSEGQLTNENAPSIVLVAPSISDDSNVK